jgi:hypothetical protein
MLAGLHVTRVQERSPFLNMMIYGDSGVGKTTLAGSADAVPAMRPVIFIDVEGGTESLRNSYPDVEVVRVKTWAQMQGVYNELYNDKGETYRTVVLDSLTEIQKFNMYDIMARQTVLKPEMDPDIPSMREWGKNIEQIRKFVRAFRDLSVHTIFTALATSDKDMRTGAITLKPGLSGKLSGEVSAFLDIVGYYYVREVSVNGEDQQLRLLCTQKTERAVAKDRSGRLPAIQEKPTMTSLFEIMYPKPAQLTEVRK